MTYYTEQTTFRPVISYKSLQKIKAQCGSQFLIDGVRVNHLYAKMCFLADGH